MAKTLEEEARELAKIHQEIDGGTHIAMFFPSENEEELKMLEVSSSLATSGETNPFFFEKNEKEGIMHNCSLILLSDQEWDDVCAERLSLPKNWNLHQAKEVL